MRNNLNLNVRRYVLSDPVDENSEPWISKREIPSSLEIKGLDENDDIEEDIEIPVNKVHAPWESKEEYLRDHYLLLREDAISPLRNAVAEVRKIPHMSEKDSIEDTAIYNKVFIVGFTFANAGIAARISFSIERVGKKILWEQSKRLLSGTIIALTTKEDKFRSICIVAVVAARPLARLEQTPPEIDIFFAAPEEIEIDPQQEWLMVECRNGFFEAYRYTLKSLQRLSKESSPMMEHVVSLSPEIEPPEYVLQQPKKDLSNIFKPCNGESFSNVDLLENWPVDAESHLDASQLDALRRILTKRLAIVQGEWTAIHSLSILAILILLLLRSTRNRENARIRRSLEDVTQKFEIWRSANHSGCSYQSCSRSVASTHKAIRRKLHSTWWVHI